MREGLGLRLLRQRREVACQALRDQRAEDRLALSDDLNRAQDLGALVDDEYTLSWKRRNETQFQRVARYEQGTPATGGRRQATFLGETAQLTAGYVWQDSCYIPGKQPQGMRDISDELAIC
jgi:hypothetical protein